MCKFKENKGHDYYLISISGESEVGKTTLVAKLQGIDAPKKGSGLEYGYLDIRDDYRDGKLDLTLVVCDPV